MLNANGTLGLFVGMVKLVISGVASQVLSPVIADVSVLRIM